MYFYFFERVLCVFVFTLMYAFSNGWIALSIWSCASGMLTSDDDSLVMKSWNVLNNFGYSLIREASIAPDAKIK